MTVKGATAPAPTPVPEPTPTPTPTPEPGTRAFEGVRPYGAKAPWNVPVANLPRHPESAKYANFVFNDGGRNYFEMNFRKYTYPVYNALEATDVYSVKDRNNWGNLNGKTIPFNPAWKPNAGTDAQIIILDPVSGKEINLWDVIVDTNTKQLSIGNGNLCPGDYFTNSYDTKSVQCQGSRGAGINYLAMLVRPWELEKGKIEHALSMPVVSTSGSFYVAPATKLEHPGKVGNIPEGMRFALNVTYEQIDAYVNSLAEVKDVHKRTIRIVLVALKEYGWFVTDTSGGASFQFEAPESAQAKWEKMGVLPTQSVNGIEHPRFSLANFITADKIITIVPSDQYPQ